MSSDGDRVASVVRRFDSDRGAHGVDDLQFQRGGGKQGARIFVGPEHERLLRNALCIDLSKKVCLHIPPRVEAPDIGPIGKLSGEIG